MRIITALAVLVLLLAVACAGGDGRSDEQSERLTPALTPAEPQLTEDDLRAALNNRFGYGLLNHSADFPQSMFLSFADDEADPVLVAACETAIGDTDGYRYHFETHA